MDLGLTCATIKPIDDRVGLHLGTSSTLSLIGLMGMGLRCRRAISVTTECYAAGLCVTGDWSSGPPLLPYATSTCVTGIESSRPR